ncbi:MAG: cytochrome c-type biogenesis protein CcmH [Acidimicrobiia bacterium]
MRRWLPWAALAALVVATVAVAWSDSGGGDTSPEARHEALTEELRCPTCQGLSVADSPSSTARAISDDVRRRIDEGQTDEEIRQAYVDRYGEWILLEPPGSGVGLLVWLLPVAGLLVGGGVLVVALTRWRREPRYTPTAEDRELVERERRQEEDPGAAGAR